MGRIKATDNFNTSTTKNIENKIISFLNIIWFKSNILRTLYKSIVHYAFIIKTKVCKLSNVQTIEYKSLSIV